MAGSRDPRRMALIQVLVLDGAVLLTRGQLAKFGGIPDGEKVTGVGVGRQCRWAEAQDAAQHLGQHPQHREVFHPKRQWLSYKPRDKRLNTSHSSTLTPHADQKAKFTFRFLGHSGPAWPLEPHTSYRRRLRPASDAGITAGLAIPG